MKTVSKLFKGNKCNTKRWNNPEINYEKCRTGKQQNGVLDKVHKSAVAENYFCTVWRQCAPKTRRPFILLTIPAYLFVHQRWQTRVCTKNYSVLTVDHHFCGFCEFAKMALHHSLDKCTKFSLFPGTFKGSIKASAAPCRVHISIIYISNPS